MVSGASPHIVTKEEVSEFKLKDPLEVEMDHDEHKSPDLAQLLLPIIKIPEKKEDSPKAHIPTLSLEDSSNALFKSAVIGTNTVNSS